jgi:hypothetical protein
MMAWIRLRHGRHNLLTTESECEVDGPVFGPFLTIHENDGREIRCGEVWKLSIVNASVYYGGMYYRTWEIFHGSVRDCERDRMCCFSPDLAKLPHWDEASDSSFAVILFD